jgi:hemerythrin
LTEFKAHLSEHFQYEESHLRAVGYPKLSAHAKHHAEMIVVLDRLIGDVQNGEPTDGVAYICFHELVSAILLRDMQFINWLADN